MTKKTNLNIDSDINYQFEYFFELTPDLLCIAGYDGYFKKINPAVSKLLEYSNDELLSKPINEFIYFEDTEFTSRVRNELTKNNPLLHFENRYVTKSGEIVWLSWTSMPVDKDQLVFAIAKNITHKKKHDEDRNVLLSNLTKDNYELKQLTYTNSHDLRSPVGNLLSIFNLLDVSKIKHEETLTFIDMLKSASESLMKTINDHVDLLEQKNCLNVTIEELDLNDTLNKVLSSIKSLIKDSRVSITVYFSELEKIKFNKAYLESIFLNLITNSIKFAKPDSPTAITIYSQNNNGTHQLVISDTGLGFDMDKVKGKLFGLNQKFHNHTDSKGIGLYLVYNHVTSLGGQITVKSKVNKGTKFTISFKN